MYEAFYGLRERPFDLTPNPRFLLLTPGHRRALVNLELGIASHKGVLVLIGEPGTGKTTVARALMGRRDATTTFVYLNQALASPADLRRRLVQAFNLGLRAEESNTDLVTDLTRRLMTFTERGATVALVVDEAQSLSDELLEEVRLLTNVETTEKKLLTLILIGQPRLATRLNDEMWTQLKQRVEVRCVLAALQLDETAAYISHRIRTAGGDAVQLFTADAIRLIHERSRGIARSISVICENALAAGFAESERPVTRRLVLQVCEELDLTAPAETAPQEEAASILQMPATQSATHSQERRPRRADAAVDSPRPAPARSRPRRWWFFWTGAWLRS